MTDEHPSDESVINGAPVGDDQSAPENLEWPIGFMLVVALAALYVLWRVIQVFGRIFDVIG